MIFVNEKRTKKERSVRYCFLRHLGLNRNMVRAIVGRRDIYIIKTIENLPKEAYTDVY